MISALWNGVLGLKAFQKSAEVTANNIANVNTDGFKKSRAVIQEDKSGNPQVAVDKVDLSGYKVREMTGEGPVDRELSNVDLAEETVDLIVEQRGFEGNVKTIQAADEMLGALLDVKT